jgi:hypothetical protein
MRSTICHRSPPAREFFTSAEGHSARGRPASAVFQPLLANLVATDVEVPDVFRHALEVTRRVNVDSAPAGALVRDGALECGSGAAAFSSKCKLRLGRLATY